MTTKNFSLIPATLVAIASLNFIGCASVKGGLVGSEHENLMPFAEQTVASLGVERLDFRDSEFAYLRAIADANANELVELRKLLALADEFRDEIVYYSIELVRVAEMNGTEEERVKEYADALSIMRTQFNVHLDMDDSEFAMIEANIRDEPTLLGALRQAQPLINRAGEQFEELLREIEERGLPNAVDYLDGAIEDSYAVFLQYNNDLNDFRDELLRASSLTRQYRLGDASAMAELQGLPDILQGRQIPDTPSEAQLSELEQHLLSQLRIYGEVGEFLAADVDAYLKAHGELEREVREVIDGLNVARLQIVAWTRAHQAMADGAKEPGRWFKVALDAASAVRRSKY